MFRTVFPSIIRSLRLYIQHQVYVKQILLTASQQAVSRIWFRRHQIFDKMGITLGTNNI